MICLQYAYHLLCMTCSPHVQSPQPAYSVRCVLSPWTPGSTNVLFCGCLDQRRSRKDAGKRVSEIHSHMDEHESMSLLSIRIGDSKGTPCQPWRWFAAHSPLFGGIGAWFSLYKASERHMHAVNTWLLGSFLRRAGSSTSTVRDRWQLPSFSQVGARVHDPQPSQVTPMSGLKPPV